MTMNNISNSGGHTCCGENIQTTTHYLLHCPNYLNERMTLLNNLQNVEENILDTIPDFQRYSFSVIHLKMQKTQNATIQYISDIQRFDVPLTILRKLQKIENLFTMLSPP